MHISRIVLPVFAASSVVLGEKRCCRKGSATCALPKNALGAASEAVPTASAAPTSSDAAAPKAKAKGSGSKSSPISDWDGVNPFTPQNCPGVGAFVTNLGKETETFYFFDNYWNGVGTAGANFDNPEYKVELKPEETKHVPLPPTFKGRVQRGTEVPATWVEFQLFDGNDQTWGNISLQKGYDGPVTIHSTDGSGHVGGFMNDAFEGAPAEAYRYTASGKKALDGTSAYCKLLFSR